MVAFAVVVAVACDIHAERHLAKAGGSNCKLRGIPTLAMERSGVERAERSGGLHKRSAEDWGHGLRARGAELPLGVWQLHFIRSFWTLAATLEVSYAVQGEILRRANHLLAIT